MKTTATNPTGKPALSVVGGFIRTEKPQASEGFQTETGTFLTCQDPVDYKLSF